MEVLAEGVVFEKPLELTRFSRREVEVTHAAAAAGSCAISSITVRRVLIRSQGRWIREGVGEIGLSERLCRRASLVRRCCRKETRGSVEECSGCSFVSWDELREEPRSCGGSMRGMRAKMEGKVRVWIWGKMNDDTGRGGCTKR